MKAPHTTDGGDAMGRARPSPRPDCRRALGARPALALAATLIAATFAGTPATGAVLPQDDANSGGDAPGTFAEGLVIAPGTYEGRLDPVPFAALFHVYVLDEEDWYRFAADAGDRITYSIAAGMNDTFYHGLYMELRDPSGRFVAYRDGGTWIEAWKEPISLRAHEAGLWALRVFSADVGDTYTFQLDVAAAADPFVAQVSSGYAAMSFEVGSGNASVDLVWTQAGVAHRDGPGLFGPYTIYDLDDPDLGWVADGGGLLIGSTWPSLDVVTGQHRLKLAHMESDAELLLHHRTGALHWTMPGRFVMVTRGILGEGEVYVALEARANGDARVRDVRNGGEESYVALTRGDYDGTLGVGSAYVNAALALFHEFDVQHRLDASFGPLSGCEGYLVAPDGTEHACGAWTEQPGTWTARVDQHASVEPPVVGVFSAEFFDFVAFDLDLPK